MLLAFWLDSEHLMLGLCFMNTCTCKHMKITAYMVIYMYYICMIETLAYMYMYIVHVASAVPYTCVYSTYFMLAYLKYMYMYQP